jgi:hypothetical protein
MGKKEETRKKPDPMNQHANRAELLVLRVRVSV